MFEDWTQDACEYVSSKLDRKPFQAIANELDADVEDLCGLYVNTLLANGLIDEEGNATDVDFDEDDLLEALLERFLSTHPCEDERVVLYASLIDCFLALVDEMSEDI